MSCGCVKKENKCGCNKSTPACGCTTVCGCTTKLSTKCVIYEGADLNCLGIKRGETLENVLIKLDAHLCRLFTVVAPDPPTKHDLTGKVTDPLDINEPALNGGLYNPGDTLTIGNNPLCPSYVYEVFSNGAGQNCVILTNKPDGASSSTSS